ARRCRFSRWGCWLTDGCGLRHRLRLTHWLGCALQRADRMDQRGPHWLSLIGLAARLRLARRLIHWRLRTACRTWFGARGKARRAGPAIIEVVRGRLAAHDRIEFAQRLDLLGDDTAHRSGAGPGFFGQFVDAT